ncbi:MAG: hypothetical protein HZC36_04425 [Armatimonadetes bacterium]|nr:hypothetical protein [Armatimonadota bacterium]
MTKIVNSDKAQNSGSLCKPLALFGQGSLAKRSLVIARTELGTRSSNGALVAHKKCACRSGGEDEGY